MRWCGGNLMALVPGRCPSCGEQIPLDDSKEKGFCFYCGSPVVVRKAATRAETAPVAPRAAARDEALVKRGYMELENGNDKDASKAFDQALNINPENYLSWKGKFEALQLNRKLFVEQANRNRGAGAPEWAKWDLWGIFMGCPDYGGKRYDLYADIMKSAISFLDTAYKFAPADKKQEIANMKDQYISSPLSKLRQMSKLSENGLCPYCGGKYGFGGKCKNCGQTKVYIRISED